MRGRFNTFMDGVEDKIEDILASVFGNTQMAETLATPLTVLLLIGVVIIAAIAIIFVIGFVASIIGANGKTNGSQGGKTTGNNSSTQNKQLSTPSKTGSRDIRLEPASNLQPQMRWREGYYRNIRANVEQPVIKRTAEQQKIYDEYFVVENYRNTTCDPSAKKTSELLRYISIALAAVGGIITVINIFTGKKGFIIFGILCLIAAIGCVIASKSFFKKFENSIKSSLAPEKLLSHDEYEGLVAKKIEEMNVVQLGLNRLGLDESQVEEVKPIILKDRALIDTSLHVFDSEKGVIHSSTQHVTLLYFTNEELFVYKIEFDMCCNKQQEWTSEFFYEDICDITTNIDKNILELGSEKLEYSTVSFNVIASNSSIGFSVDGDNPNVSSINGMKQKIRDRKNT